jgi:riboflavin kinase/FMN adenylyltransferase
MWTVRGLGSYPSDARPCALALGVFDGVHLGHRAILAAAVARAREAHLTAVACTFDPHPLEILNPERAPLPVCTLEERLELFAGSGVDGAVVLAFTPALAAVEPEAFVKDVLVDRLRAREVVVGFNHRFGRGARGDARLLVTLGARYGFRAHLVPALTVDGVTVSSTEVRAALQRGDVDRAARLLGRGYSLPGTVVAGAGRGRTLGFPTANVEVDRPPLVPAGVYACRARLAGALHPAVVNVGVRPTFGGQTLAVEAHLLDFKGDLYGARMILEFVAHLRDERRFPSVEALASQIRDDVVAARRCL